MKYFPIPSLSERDKKTLLAGSLSLILLLLLVLWQWLSQTIVSAEQQVEKDRSLLAWMQAADLRLQQSLRTQAPHSAKGTLAASIQAALDSEGLISHVAELRQNENGSVKLVLKKVDFDAVLRMLGTLQQQAGASLSQIHVTRLADTGAVDASMTLQEAMQQGR